MNVGVSTLCVPRKSYHATDSHEFKPLGPFLTSDDIYASSHIFNGYFRSVLKTVNVVDKNTMLLKLFTFVLDATSGDTGVIVIES